MSLLLPKISSSWQTHCSAGISAQSRFTFASTWLRNGQVSHIEFRRVITRIANNYIQSPWLPIFNLAIRPLVRRKHMLSARAADNTVVGFLVLPPSTRAQAKARHTTLLL